jgi:hypothetical protein
MITAPKAATMTATAAPTASTAAPTTMIVARKALARACDELDAAVRALPDPDGDDVVASPDLVALLLRVVVARRQVSGLELDLVPDGLGVVGRVRAPRPQ